MAAAAAEFSTFRLAERLTVVCEVLVLSLVSGSVVLSSPDTFEALFARSALSAYVYAIGALRDQLSFPTRRSSDLTQETVPELLVQAPLAETKLVPAVNVSFKVKPALSE